jgi:hypothetical protein
LPLFPSLMSRFQSGDRGRRRRASSDDQLLGFGVGEAVIMFTPVILNFTSALWQDLVAEAARDSAQGVVELIKARLPERHRAGANQALTLSQLQHVRTAAERVAVGLGIPEDQAKLLADAAVGVLATPPVS